jgi:hypothetical protein
MTTAGISHEYANNTDDNNKRTEKHGNNTNDNSFKNWWDTVNINNNNNVDKNANRRIEWDANNKDDSMKT